jgi:cytochrome oxidase assembly protein ShyY1
VSDARTTGARKWLGYLGVVVVFAVVCGFLAHWQWSRHEEKTAVVHQLEQRYDAAPVPLDEAVPDLDSYDPALEWQPVTRNGTNQIATVQLSEVQARVSGTIYSAAYGLLQSETPAPAEAPVKASAPEIDTGLNLSYFVQWIMFAVGAFAFLFYVFRQERRNRAIDEEGADGDEARVREAERARRRAARPLADNDAEDELLDAAGH